MSNYKTEIEFSNLRLIIKALKDLDKKYLAEFYKEAKEIAKPVQAAIIKAIPASSPVRGMKAKSQRARLGWGIGKRAKSVVIRANRTIKRKSSFAKGKINSYPLVQVVAQSPGTVLADMAGKTNRYTNKKARSRKHEIDLFGRGVIVERTYKINGQGINLINALAGGKGVLSSKPSRWFWPAALRAMPEAARKVQNLISKTNGLINKSIGT
jgi:hypothetical protein